MATGPNEGPADCGASGKVVPGTEGIPVVEEEVPEVGKVVPVMEEEVPVTAGITLDFCGFPCNVTGDAVIRKAKALRKDEWYF